MIERLALSVRSPLTAASATFALKVGVWFRRGRLVMVSPDSQAQRPRCQGKTPLIVPCNPPMIWLRGAFANSIETHGRADAIKQFILAEGLYEIANDSGTEGALPNLSIGIRGDQNCWNALGQRCNPVV